MPKAVVLLSVDDIDHLLVAIATMAVVKMPPEAQVEYDAMKPLYIELTAKLVKAKQAMPEEA